MKISKIMAVQATGLLALLCAGTARGPETFSVRIPTGGNSWVVNNEGHNRSMIHKSGIRNWDSVDDVIRTYFHADTTGEIAVGLSLKVPSGTSKIKVSVDSEIPTTIKFSGTGYEDVSVGKFNLRAAGYHYVEIQGIKRSSSTFAEVNEVLLGGPATQRNVSFIKDEKNFYFGRRGPSDHLTYVLPPGKDFTWFYSEITVPEGNDVVGSYFMANGFAQGYFGMQVNSDKERRILFSVWSPFKTDNPSEIPDDQKIKLLGKGAGVTTGEFGNEGSGGQSYYLFNWKSGTTYRFLLKGQPADNNSTDFTAWFYAPETGNWKLIASFRRPQTQTHLRSFHSFLENFIPDGGYITRYANYGNQWARDTEGNWHELTEAKYSIDQTGRMHRRMDYAGGTTGNTFFLKNCGFFSDNTAPGSVFARTANSEPPDVELSQLKMLPGEDEEF